MTKTTGIIDLSQECSCQEIEAVLEAEDVFCNKCKNKLIDEINQYLKMNKQIRCIVEELS